MSLRSWTSASHVVKVLSLLLMSTALASCGGGSRSNPAPPPTPPAPLDSDQDSVADTLDCAPTNAARWQLLAYSSVDSDGDTHRVNTTGQQCSGATLPATFFATAVDTADLDCDDTASARWRMLPYAARDADLDNFSIPQTGEACSGDTLPAGYADTVPAQAQAAPDCDDSKAVAWRYMVIYADADGDGTGAGAGQPTCVGSGAPAGFSLTGYDPLDSPNDPTAASVNTYELSPWHLSTL
jgi:hypothetical protein